MKKPKKKSTKKVSSKKTSPAKAKKKSAKKSIPVKAKKKATPVAKRKKAKKVTASKTKIKTVKKPVANKATPKVKPVAVTKPKEHKKFVTVEGTTFLPEGGPFVAGLGDIVMDEQLEGLKKEDEIQGEANDSLKMPDSNSVDGQ